MAKKWREELEKVLKVMESSDPDIEASAIVRADGLVMASALPKSADEGLIAAMSAAILNIGARALEELAKGELEKIIVSGDKGDITIVGIGKEAVLSAITRPGANIGLTLVEMGRARDKIMEILRSM
ncbi:MAG: roadblock/LC7 domain-containing protein [Candidatus Freyarchaeota archaeon]|nr:roadblock/LC7 domain-containing protein [Candidatus Freyrarchaeum guaymaensis]